MAELTDLENAYLIGIRDGFQLARVNTQAEAEDLIARNQGRHRCQDACGASRACRARQPANHSGVADRVPKWVLCHDATPVHSSIRKIPPLATRFRAPQLARSAGGGLVARPRYG
jgi:hypothetical protein